MKKRIQGLLLVSAILLGCSSMTPIAFRTNVKGYDYNDILSQYTPMNVNVEAYNSNDGRVLRYFFDTYEYSTYGKDRVLMAVSSKNANEVIAAIDKYLEWEKIAKDSGDELDKPISVVKDPLAMASDEYHFSFHSGNKTNHYLVMDWYSPMIQVSSICLSPTDAQTLKQEIINFVINGKASTVNLDKYQ